MHASQSRFCFTLRVSPQASLAVGCETGANQITIHSAYPSFLQRSLAVSVAAARDIEPGEEITISCGLRPTNTHLLGAVI